MRWKEEAARFEHLDVDKVLDFADAEMKAEAVERYNRALGQIQSGSGDIASIALRQLASAYPDFLEARLLSAVSQMAWGEMNVALETLESIDYLDILSEEERFRVDLFLKAIRADKAEVEAAELEKKQAKAAFAFSPRSGVAKKSRTRSTGRVAELDADDEYMQQISLGPDAKKILTPASSSRRKPQVWQILTGLVALLAVVLLATQLLPRLGWGGGPASSTDDTLPSHSSSSEEESSESTALPTNSPTPELTATPTPEATSAPTPTPIIPPGDAGPDSDDSDRLSWLLAALAELSVDDEGYQALWDQYMALFEPTPTPEPTPLPATPTPELTTEEQTTTSTTTTSTSTTTSATTMATPTVTPTTTTIAATPTPVATTEAETTTTADSETASESNSTSDAPPTDATTDPTTAATTDPTTAATTDPTTAATTDPTTAATESSSSANQSSQGLTSSSNGSSTSSTAETTTG